jgi:hypothetical protein
MINIQFNLRIPGSNKFQNIKCWSGSIAFTRHKFWEVQIYKASDIFDFFLRITTKQDHAGVDTGIGFLGYNLEFRIYDNRHWDKNTRDWQSI